MFTRLRSLRSNHIMKTRVICLLTVLLLISTSHPPLIGSELPTPLLQGDDPCDLLLKNVGASENSEASAAYFSVTDVLKTDFKFVMEQVDIFFYRPFGDESYPIDIDSFNVSNVSPEYQKATECSWSEVSTPTFLCFMLFANVVDNSRQSHREEAEGAIFVEPETSFDVLRDQNGDWWLEDGKTTFIIKNNFWSESGNRVELQTLSGGNLFRSNYESIAEVTIPSTIKTPFTLRMRTVSPEGKVIDTRDLTEFEVKDNSIFILSNDALGKAILREASCKNGVLN